MLFTEYLWVSAEKLMYFGEGRTVTCTHSQHALAMLLSKTELQAA
jgi:hypothetical protein